MWRIVNNRLTREDKYCAAKLAGHQAGVQAGCISVTLSFIIIHCENLGRLVSQPHNYHANIGEIFCKQKHQPSISGGTVWSQGNILTASTLYVTSSTYTSGKSPHTPDPTPPHLTLILRKEQVWFVVVQRVWAEQWRLFEDCWFVF